MATNIKFHRITATSGSNINTGTNYTKGDVYFIKSATGNTGKVYICTVAGKGTAATLEDYSVDTNTWRPVVNNLTSTSADSSLSAAMGKSLSDSITSLNSSLSNYLPLSGGTMTNPIKFSYNNNGDCNVSRNSGFSMFFGNQSGAENQGFPIQYSSVISFMTGYCGMQFATYGGNDNRLFFRKISDSDVWTPWYTLLHSNNYNSYSPKLDGTGASGTWGINISGNAASATNAGYATTAGSAPASDVYSWAKQSTKPSYSFNEITSKPTTLAGYGITETNGYLNKISKSGNTLTITPKDGTAFTFTNTTYSRKWDDNLSNTDYPGYGDAVADALDTSFSLVNVGDMKRWNKASYMLEGLETLLASI